MIDPKPVLKWVGGKRQLLPYLIDKIPANFNTYHEPFIGGGALFFDLHRLKLIKQASVIADANPELINFYRALRDDFQQLCVGLKDLAKNHVNEHDFYALRRDYKQYSDIGRAALLLYFNKTAFNGLMRQNKSGDWNMPWGFYSNPKIYDEPALEAAHQTLWRTAICCQDFETTLQGAQPGDVVYCDPPYVPVSKTASFVGYSKDGFCLEDQARLINTAATAAAKGVRIIMSNADTPETWQLFTGYSNFAFQQVTARRAVNCKAHKRGSVGELIITNI